MSSMFNSCQAFVWPEFGSACRATDLLGTLEWDMTGNSQACLRIREKQGSACMLATSLLTVLMPSDLVHPIAQLQLHLCCLSSRVACAAIQSCRSRKQQDTDGQCVRELAEHSSYVISRAAGQLISFVGCRCRCPAPDCSNALDRALCCKLLAGTPELNIYHEVGACWTSG